LRKHQNMNHSATISSILLLCATSGAGELVGTLRLSFRDLDGAAVTITQNIQIFDFQSER
jgi:hypothetical protein